MDMVIFIVNGGISIGMGHIMRSLSLAKQFRKKNYEIKFISKYECGIDVIKNYNFEVIKINTSESSIPEGFNYGTSVELEEDMKKIEEILIIEKPDVLVIDTYNVSNEFFLSMKKHAKCVIYIDDIYSFDYPVDIIINGNVTGENMGYKRLFKEQRFLLGLKYNLIRDEFINIPRKRIKEIAENIMITTGAADPYNMTYQFLKHFLNNNILKGKKYHVIVGNSFQNKNKIEELAKRHENIYLHYNANKMSDIMLKADIAISSGGSTLYELLACGIPIMSFIYADNQKLIVEKMESLGYLKNIGYYDSINYKILEYKLEQFLLNQQERKMMVEKTRNLIDCKGTERIIEVVKTFL